MERDTARPGGLLAALARYREAAGHGGDDLLLATSSAGEVSAASRRREDVVRRAVAQGDLGRADAERIHDIAREEGLEPAFAFELVRSRVAVCDAPPDAPVPPEGTSLDGVPEWIAPSAVSEPLPTEAVVRERRLRLSFRRLRGHLERSGTAEEAILSFLAEPDVGECGYLLD